MTKPIAEIWWDSTNDCAWQLKMLCEPAVAHGTRIPLGWMNEDFRDRFPLTPEQVYSNDDIMSIDNDLSFSTLMRIIRCVEHLHGIK